MSAASTCSSSSEYEALRRLVIVKLDACRLSLDPSSHDARVEFHDVHHN